MGHDGILLAAARKQLSEIRSKNEAEETKRKNEIYSRIPEVAVIDARLATHWTELALLTLKGGSDLAENLNRLKDENLNLQMKRAELLAAHGYCVEYLDPIYNCKICSDTGMADGKICECLQKLYNKEVTNNLSALLINGNESFENFDSSLYPDVHRPGIQYSQREYMITVKDRCVEFAESFPSPGLNLLFQGSTGLGKTYLSACIAKAVSAKGYSVCYKTAVSALEVFEKEKFSKSPEEQESAAANVRRELDCDLLILDDLGTEMITSMSTSALYTLINTRLISGKQTIISTNLRDEELATKYSEQICSRLQGSYTKYPFTGNDIRKLLK